MDISRDIVKATIRSSPIYLSRPFDSLLTKSGTHKRGYPPPRCICLQLVTKIYDCMSLQRHLRQESLALVGVQNEQLIYRDCHLMGLQDSRSCTSNSYPLNTIHLKIQYTKQL